VNLEFGMAGRLTDKLLNGQLRKTGRRKKLTREREEVNAQDSLARKLQNLTRMTSGSLASVGQDSLSIEVLVQEDQAKAMAAANKETELQTNQLSRCSSCIGEEDREG
jgi:hypothetical protein